MEIDAFILVGGRSSRFGSDKANIHFDGIPLLERTVRTIRAALDSKRITLIAANDTQFTGSAAFLISLPVVYDIHEDRGPFGAVHAALANAQTEWAFITACDFPFVPAELIERLVANISSNVDAVAPIQPDGRLQPLVALYRVKPVLNFVNETLTNNRSSPSVKVIFEQLRSTLVTFETLADIPNAGDIFLNLNTPADLRCANEIAGDKFECNGAVMS